MPYDHTLRRGPGKSSQHNAGKANTYNVPIIGIVKDNIDPTRSGTVQVFLTNSLPPVDPDNSDSWVPVKYLSNFFGKVRPTASDDDFGTYKRTPSSYGQWHSPPDIGSKVLCIFNNGDPNDGFYLGCVLDPEDLFMVPAIGSAENVILNEGEAARYGGAERLPVTNFNTNNKSLFNSPEYLTSPRPVHSYTASIMFQQGIIRDTIRGPISSSAQREAASRVGWGVSTPGRPIYEGGFDDESIVENLEPGGNEEQLKVISRRGGHSIVMDDGDVIGRDQLVRIRTALGHQILMSDDGQTLMLLHSNGQSYIELGKEGTVDVYSTNSINMRSQGDINFHADRNINFHAGEKINAHSTSFQVDADESLDLRSEGTIKAFSLGDSTIKSSGAIALNAASDASMTASGEAYINGSKVNLNSGTAPTSADEIKKIPLIAQTDTLFDKQQGFIAAPGKLLSITSRTPAHAPWTGAGQGVDVEVSLDADTVLPANPEPSIRNLNNLASEISSSDSAVGRMTSKVPTNKAVSKVMDQNVTGALLSSMAVAAFNDPDKKIAAVSGVGPTGVNRNSGTSSGLAIGAFAQTPKQLANAGAIKPGSDKRIIALARSFDARNTTAEKYKTALPSLVFTGQSGATGIESLTNGLGIQSGIATRGMTNGLSEMKKIGAVTGKEDAVQLSGIVSATSQLGSKLVVNTINQNGAGPAAAVIGRGVAATQLATSVQGGQSGLAGALRLTNELDQSKGISGSAFNAIKRQFPVLTAGTPQNLAAITRQARDSNSSGLDKVGSVASLSAVSASGLLNISGGQRAVASVTNNARDATNTLQGVRGLTTQITGLLNNESPNGTINLNKQPSLKNSIGITGLDNQSLATITAAASSVSSGYKNSIKTPSTSFNTLTRTSISEQVTNLLFDPGIPSPNLLGEVSDASITLLDDTTSKGREVFNLIKEFEHRTDEINAARDAFLAAESTLPQGDPKIAVLRNEWFSLLDDPDYQSLLKQIRDVKGTGKGFLISDQIVSLDTDESGDNDQADVDFDNL